MGYSLSFAAGSNDKDALSSNMFVNDPNERMQRQLANSQDQLRHNNAFNDAPLPRTLEEALSPPITIVPLSLRKHRFLFVLSMSIQPGKDFVDIPLLSVRERRWVPCYRAPRRIDLQSLPLCRTCSVEKKVGQCSPTTRKMEDPFAIVFE